MGISTVVLVADASMKYVANKTFTGAEMRVELQPPTNTHTDLPEGRNNWLVMEAGIFLYLK